MGDQSESETPAALQVIVLGSGGGPLESNITALLVRAVAQGWARGSIVAVDAGVHLAAIARLLDDAFPSPPPAALPHVLARGPFAGLPLPFATAAANAAHVAGALVDTYLITHPHLDHISGLVVNTAGLPASRPKKLAGLPSTIHALKSHVFNNVIWPNLSDENNGAGLLTYLRLVDGGSPALGDGRAKGYLEVCDGLLVKTWSVSHGHCIEKHSHRGSASSASPRFGSHDASAAPAAPARRDLYAHAPPAAAHFAVPQFAVPEQEQYCVYDSSAYFIRDQDHRREVLIFGDVEPDSLSLSPRNLPVWREAAPKVADGTLAAIFIECSYDDSRANDRLYGHLKPVFVVEELQVLAAEIAALRCPDTRKRKRLSLSGHAPHQRPGPGPVLDEPVSPKSARPALSASHEPSEARLLLPAVEVDEVDELALRRHVPATPEDAPPRPLEGLKVVIIHVKETLEVWPDPGDTILSQLYEHEKQARLGCEYIISKPGQSFFF